MDERPSVTARVDLATVLLKIAWCKDYSIIQIDKNKSRIRQDRGLRTI